jgi:proteasome lid subunit RPN8/RPN11
MSSRKVKFGAEEQPEAQDQAWWGRGVRPTDLGTLGGLTLYRCHDQQRQSGDYNILFSQKAYRDVVRHLKADTAREHGGLLLGYATGTSGPAIPTVFVTHALPAKHTAGTPTSLTFTNETWAEWDIVAEEFLRLGIDLQRVGWYHSHPNIEIFLSRYDLDVCTTFDRLKCPVALVVDPIRDRGGFFIRGREGYQPHSPKGFWEIHAEAEAGVEWRNLEQVPFQRTQGRQADSREAHAETQPLAVITRDAVEGGDRVTDPTLGSEDERLLADPGNRKRRWSLTAALLATTVLALAAVAGVLGLLAATVRQQQTKITGLESILKGLHEQVDAIKGILSQPQSSGQRPAEQAPVTHERTSSPPAAPSNDKKATDPRKKQSPQQQPPRDHSDNKKASDGTGTGAQTSTPVELKPSSGASPEQKKDSDNQEKPEKQDKQDKKQGFVPPVPR